VSARASVPALSFPKRVGFGMKNGFSSLAYLLAFFVAQSAGNSYREK
jgi:hypothetical protein